MVSFLASASRAAVIALKCPHCGHVQARARGEADARYRCKSCHRLFSAEEGKMHERRSR